MPMTTTSLDRQCALDAAATVVFSEDEEWDSDELDEREEVKAWSESVSRYTPRFYYPTTIEEVFHQRYMIVHKPSRGGCSTVWLSQDTKEKIYIALKILTPAEREHTHGESNTINECLQHQGTPNLVSTTAHLRFC
jgi:hypothetical protein